MMMMIMMMIIIIIHHDDDHDHDNDPDHDHDYDETNYTVDLMSFTNRTMCATRCMTTNAKQCMTRFR